MEAAINFPCKEKVKILSFGAESVGRFAFYNNGNIFISENFGDILDEKNLNKFAKSVSDYVKNKKPDLVLTDLHPLYNSTALGEKLSQKLEIPHVKVQHHIAHIFSALGDYLLNIQYSTSNIQIKTLNTKYLISNTFLGIAADGTGYGLDGNIWGGEVFEIKILNSKSQIPNKFQISNSKIKISRVGSLEEQTMIGGDLAVREPARMLIAILAKILNLKSQILNKLQITNYKLQTKFKMQSPNFKREFIYRYVKKYYSRNEFELLYNQLQQNFNCQKTTSAGRILDAVSVLLGFAGNKRNFKHEATKMLEKNSSIAYDIKPLILVERWNIPECKNQKSHAYRQERKIKTTNQNAKFILQTTPLFEYLIKNIHKDKKRLAATAQEYIAKGFYEIVKKIPNTKLVLKKHRGYQIPNTFFAGGMANNKIMSSYLESKGVYMSKKIPRGDEGIAVGQIVYYLLKTTSINKLSLKSKVDFKSKLQSPNVNPPAGGPKPKLQNFGI